MIFVSGSGFLGAKRESRNLLFTYSAMMTLVLVSEVVLLVCLKNYQQNMQNFLDKPAGYRTRYMKMMLANARIDTDFSEDLMNSKFIYKNVIEDILIQARDSTDIGDKVLYVLEFSCGFTFSLLLLSLVNILLIANYFEQFQRNRSRIYTNVSLVEITSQNSEEGVNIL